MELAKVVTKIKLDLEKAVGKELANELISRRGENWRKLPSSIRFYDSKPAFYLNDGSTLQSFGYDLAESRSLGERYLGSGDSAINTGPILFAEGITAPKNKALIFIESYWNGRNTSWTVYIVSSNLTPQLN